MPTYYATICHHSISRARVITINGTLTEAKAQATEEFGDGFIDHVLTIYGAAPNGELDRDYVVATRKLNSKRWR